MKYGTTLAVAVTAASALVGVLGRAAERPHFDSYQNDGPITIDGRLNEWSGSLEQFGSEPLSIQVAHDNEFVYVRMASSDPGTRMQMTRLGLILWFDPKGGTKKTLGIHYPVIQQSMAEEGRGREGSRGGYRRRGEGERPPDDAFEPPDRVDVLGPGKDDARSLTREHLQGIDVAMAMDQGTVMYELKVPLKASADRPYAIGAGKGQTIGVGIETPKFERPSGGREGGGGMGRGGGGMGGFGGRGGGGHGGGRGGEGRGEFQPPKQIKGWATVTLK